MKEEQFRAAVSVQVRDCDCRALIAPRHPVRYLLPVAPSAGDVALRVQLAANSVETPIRSGHAMFDLKHNQPQSASSEVCDGYARPLVFDASPVRDLDPRAPASGYISLRIEPPPDPIESSVHSGRRMVHPEHDQLRKTVIVQIGDRDVGALILERRPVRDLQEIESHKSPNAMPILSGTGKNELMFSQGRLYLVVLAFRTCRCS